MRSWRFLFFLGLLPLVLAAGPALRAADTPFELRPDDRVVFAGNTFAERMALYGYLETFLHCAFPEHRLVVRNLGWSGDEVDLMPRPANFGTFTEHLTWQEADVVFLCYGLNESFAGETGLEAWRQRLNGFLASLQARSFNGEAPPRLVLVSPIAHEDLGSPLPTGEAVVERNRILGLYTAVMAEVAKERGVRFVDVLSPTRGRGTPDAPLTVNGIHLNERGYHAVSREMALQLGWLRDREGVGSEVDTRRAQKLRRAVYEKNRLFFLQWRPSNPFYIWGGRAYCWAKDEPMVELERIGAMIAAREDAIRSESKPVPSSVWGDSPGEKEIWEDPMEHGGALDGTPPRLPAVRRNGVLK